jgi:hypothetical protein
VQTRTHDSSRLTFSELVAAVSVLTDDEVEAAEVINHMLRSEKISFESEDRQREIRQLLS